MTQRRFFLFLALFCISALFLVACDNGDTENEAQSLPAAEAQADPHAGHDHDAMPASNSFISGTIVETMNSGGYSYVLLDTGSDRVWLAGPATEGLEAGHKVSTPDGMEMKNFTAKSLDKTFESIFFVGAFQKEGEMPAAANPHGGMGNSPAASSNTKMGSSGVTGVEKLADGFTVEEIYGQAGELGGKTVKLRGQVVKFTANIMGTNWVHIQDGTGSGDSADLTVTTSDVVATGDVVVVEGPLSVDKDFGAGYKYHVIIEGATVTK